MSYSPERPQRHAVRFRTTLSQTSTPNVKLDSNLIQACMFWEDGMIHPTIPSNAMPLQRHTIVETSTLATTITPNHPPESVQGCKTSYAMLDTKLLQRRASWEASILAGGCKESTIIQNYPPEQVREFKTSIVIESTTIASNPKVSFIVRNIFSNYNSNFNHTEASTSKPWKRHITGLQASLSR